MSAFEKANSHNKRHRVEIKLSAEQRDLIATGAAIAKKTVPDFVRAAALQAAADLLPMNPQPLK